MRPGSCMSTGSKRRALGKYFYERICHMFLISKFKGDQKIPIFSASETHFPPEIATEQRLSFRKYPKLHRPRFQSPLPFDTKNIQQICSEKECSSARRLHSAALLECWPQVCRVKITFTELLTNRFVSTTKNSMECVANCRGCVLPVIGYYVLQHLLANLLHLNLIDCVKSLLINSPDNLQFWQIAQASLRIHVRSRNTQPHLNSAQLIKSEKEVHLISVLSTWKIATNC